MGPGRMRERPSHPSFLKRMEERVLQAVLGYVQRLERQMNHWADCCMQFMPREWVEAQGFIWADAILASVLLGLVVLSYIMFRHMLRHWGDEPHGPAAPQPSRQPRAPVVEGPSGNGRPHACLQYGPVNEEVDGLTALMRSSSQGDEACTAELIAAGAAVNVRDSQEGFTALLMASAMGKPPPPSRKLSSGDRPIPHRMRHTEITYDRAIFVDESECHPVPLAYPPPTSVFPNPPP